MEIYIILRKYVFVIEPGLSPPRTKVRVKSVIGFQENDMPIGMGAFAIGSELYLAGGEILLKQAVLTNGFNSSRLLDRRLENGGLNSTVYLYQPKSRVAFNVQNKIKSMNNPKTNPRVAEVDRRVYILSSYPHCKRDEENKYPVAFECYDRDKESWEELPEPLNYSTDPNSHRIHGLFVFNSKIYMKNNHGLQFYDIGARSWKLSDGTLDIHLGGVSFLLKKWVSVAEGIINITVVYESGVGLVGYLLDKGKYWRQPLQSVNWCLTGLGKHKEGFVYHLDDNKFSYVLSTKEPGENDFGVHVYHFQVEVKEYDGKEPYLSTSVMKFGFFDCGSHIPSTELKKIQDVVFICSKEELTVSPTVKKRVSGPSIVKKNELGKSGYTSSGSCGGPRSGCFLCGGSDHYRKDCPRNNQVNRPGCFLCGSLNHYRKDCPSNNQVNVGQSRGRGKGNHSCGSQQSRP